MRASFAACRAASPKRRARANSSRTARRFSRTASNAAICAASRSCAQSFPNAAPTPKFSQPGTTKTQRPLWIGAQRQRRWKSSISATPMAAAIAPSTAYTATDGHEGEIRMAITASTASMRKPIPTGRAHIIAALYTAESCSS